MNVWSLHEASKNDDNTPMQYTAIFTAVKYDNCQLKNPDIFLSFAQNIDCGYTVEPPLIEAVLLSTQQYMV